MKKVSAKTQPFKKIDTLKFSSSLLSAVKQLLPKNCMPKLVSRGSEIALENVPSRRRVVDAVVDALDDLGYDVYTMSDADFDIAAVKGNAFAKIIVDVDPQREDYNYSGFISIDCNNGNVTLEDWYHADEDIDASTKGPLDPDAYLFWKIFQYRPETVFCYSTKDEMVDGDYYYDDYTVSLDVNSNDPDLVLDRRRYYLDSSGYTASEQIAYGLYEVWDAMNEIQPNDDLWLKIN